MPTLTIELEEFEALRKRCEAAEAQNANHAKELTTARMTNADEIVRTLMKTFRASVEVARYATAHLSGEFARKWPLISLRAMADGIEALPDVNEYERELAIEFRNFADDVARYDAGRVERYVPPPPTNSLGILHAESPGHETHLKSRATGELPMLPVLPRPLGTGEIPGLQQPTEKDRTPIGPCDPDICAPECPGEKLQDIDPLQR